MAVSIVTPWLNHPELIEQYAAAVQGAEVIIVDNASDAETAVALDVMTAQLGNGSRVIHNAENRYFCAANNQGLAVASHDIVVFLNNDVEAPPDSRWLLYIERDTAADVLVGPSIGLFDVDGEQWPYVEGWCVAARRGVWSRLGGWDAATFKRCYADDIDLSFRARVAGYRLLKSAWRIEHLGNATNRTLPGAYDYADANREVVRQRIREWKSQQT